MADTKISAMTAAAALTGAELVPLVQGGANVKSTAGAIAALTASFGGLEMLTNLHTTQPCLINVTPPTPGNASTIATFTGAGCLRQIYFVVAYGHAWQDFRIQVFCDGEALPSIDVDIGTWFGTAFSGVTETPFMGGNQFRDTGPGADGGGQNWNTNKCWAGAMRYPIPYGNGCIVKVYCPLTMTTTGSSFTPAMFSMVTNQAGAIPAAYANLRLKSYGVAALDAPSYTRAQQIVWMNKPNNAGWIVDLALATVGAAPNTGAGELACGYLERQEYWGVDGESITPDASGAVNTAYGSSGGEDSFNRGWYFDRELGGAALQLGVASWDTMVTRVNYSDYTSCMSMSMLSRHGGIRFENHIAAGWSLKDGGPGTVNNYLTDIAKHAFQIMWYVDPSIPFVPTVPLSAAGASASATSAIYTWARPASDGSSFLTGYTVTLSPGGATQTVSAATPTATFTGLTTGTTYTASIVATNAVGNSASAATATAVPTAPTVPAAPTIGTALAGNAQATVPFTANGTGGSPITGFTVTSSPGGFTGTGASSPIVVTGLSNGTAYTFTVTATNTVGTSSASSASNSVTPTASTATWDIAHKSANASLTNGALTMTATGGGAGTRSTTSVLSGTHTYTLTNDVLNIDHIGIADGSWVPGNDVGGDTHSLGYYSGGGIVYNGGFVVSGIPTYTTGDVVTVVLDATGQSVVFKKNGTTVATVSIAGGGGSPITGPYFAAINAAFSTDAGTASFASW